MLLTLLQMAVGGLAALLLTDWRGEVTLGFLRLCALIVVPLALFAWLLPGARQAPLPQLTVVVLLAALLYFAALAWFAGRTAARRLIALIGVLAGGAAIVVLALAGPAPAGQSVALLGALADTLVLGASGVALTLGHWYLVTPRLSARPLRRLVDLLLLGIVLEAAVVIWPLASGVGAVGDVTFWGRLAAVIVLPALVTVAARACCREWPRGRALQAATGLLYVSASAVFAGVLLGNLLRFTP